MKQIGWVYDIKNLFSDEAKEHLKNELAKLNVLRIGSYITFFREFLSKLGKDDSIAVWFRPTPQKEPGSEKLRYFSNTYRFFVSKKGEISLRRSDGELLIEIKNGHMGDHCGEGLSVVKAILSELL